MQLSEWIRLRVDGDKTQTDEWRRDSRRRLYSREGAQRIFREGVHLPFPTTFLSTRSDQYDDDSRFGSADSLVRKLNSRTILPCSFAELVCYFVRESYYFLVPPLEKWIRELSRTRNIAPASSSRSDSTSITNEKHRSDLSSNVPKRVSSSKLYPARTSNG